MPLFTPASAAAITRGSLAPVATRTSAAYQSGLSNGTQTSGTSRVSHYITTDCRNLRVAYANIYTPTGGPPLDGPNPITVRMSVEDTAGKTHRGWCNGARDVVIPPGGIAWFDVDGAYKAGDRIFTRTYVQVNSGEKWPLSVATNAAAQSGIGEGNSYGTPGTDLTISGTVPQTFAFCYAPAAILGQPLTPVVTVALIGDSITQGQADSHNLGHVVRALNTAGLGYVQLAQKAESAFQFCDPATSGDTRQHVLRGVTHAIEGYGVNDIFNNARTLAQAQASVVAIWYDLARRGIKTWRTTITPKTTSTDGWSTVAGQTADAATSTRNSFNDWIRDGAPILNGVAVATGSNAAGTLRAGQTGHPLSGYFETADLVESARNSGLWKATGRAVADGAISASSTTLTSATAAFVAGDVGVAIRVAGAGASGAVLDTTISSVTNATTAVLAAAASTTVSGATVGIGRMTYTLDGTHPHGADQPANPAGLGYLAMAAAINASAFTL